MENPTIDLRHLTEEQQRALSELINQCIIKNTPTMPYSDAEKERIKAYWANKGATESELRKIADALKRGRPTKYQISHMLHRSRGK